MAEKRIFNIETEATIDDITQKVYAWFDKKAQQGEVQEPSWKFDVYLFVKILNNFATKFVPNVATVEDKCYWHDGELYVCNVAYTGDWVPGNFTATTIDELFGRNDVMEALQSELDEVADDVSAIKDNISENTSSSSEESISFVDDEDNIIAKVDEDGIHAKDIFVEVNGEEESVALQSELDEVADDVSAIKDNISENVSSSSEESISFVDDEDNIIAKVDEDGIHAKDIFVEVNGEEKNVKELTGVESVDVVLPDRVVAVVGDTLQLFYQGIVKSIRPELKYNILVTCSKGKQYPRYFEFTPSASDVGEYSLKISVKNNGGDVLGEKTCQLAVVAKLSASPSNDVKIVCIGDSLTSEGKWCAEAYRRLSGTGGSPSGESLSNISFCGSMTRDGAGYFGVGGWSWKDYATEGRRSFRFQVSGVSSLTTGAVYKNNNHNYTIAEINVTNGSGNILCTVDYGSNYSPDNTGVLTKSSGSGDSTISYSSSSLESLNPFWDVSENKISFADYADTYCDGTIDYLYALLSWNMLWAWQTDFTETLGYVKDFADEFHSEFPSGKLKLVGIQVPSITGGMGANYGATGERYADMFGMVVTSFNFNEALRLFAADDDYAGFVEYVGIAPQFDSLYNMPFNDKAVNVRNSSATEMIGTNGVHPSNYGYMQIADAVYRDIVASLSSVTPEPSGIEVPITADFSGNSDYPTSGGYYFDKTYSDNRIVKTNSQYENKVIISKKVPVSSSDYSKIRIKNTTYNIYHCICVFFDSSDNYVGKIPFLSEGSYGSTGTVEGNVPQNAAYMLFENNVTNGGAEISGPAQIFGVTA